MNLLTHPAMLVVIGCSITAAIGGIGWIIGTLISLLRDNSKLTQATSDISEILKTVVDRADKTDEMLTEIKGNLSELIGEHKAMVRAGNLIASHAKVG